MLIIILANFYFKIENECSFLSFVDAYFRSRNASDLGRLFVVVRIAALADLDAAAAASDDDDDLDHTRHHNLDVRRRDSSIQLIDAVVVVLVTVGVTVMVPARTSQLLLPLPSPM